MKKSLQTDGNSSSTSKLLKGAQCWQFSLLPYRAVLVGEEKMQKVELKNGLKNDILWEDRVGSYNPFATISFFQTMNFWNLQKIQERAI